jgi:hypothetical protein
MPINPYVSFAVLAFIMIFVAYELYRIWMRRASLDDTMEMALFEIPWQDADFSRIEAILSQVFAIEQSVWRRRLSGKRWMGVEVVVESNSARVLVVVPAILKDRFSRVIESVSFSDQVKEVEDYSIFKGSDNFSLQRVILGKDMLLPIDFSRGVPMGALWERLSPYLGEDSFAVQILFYPRTSLWHSKSLNKILSYRRHLIEKSAKSGETSKDMEEAAYKQDKLSKPCAMCNIRIVFSSKDEKKTKTFADDVKFAFEGLASENKNSFVVKKGGKNDLFEYIFREFNDGDRVLLNVDELAWFLHLK